MSQFFNIPKTTEQAIRETEIAFQTIGVGQVRRAIYTFPVAELDDPIGKSQLLGTNIYSNLVIKGRSYTDIEGKQGTFTDIVLETVLFNIAQQKNIVITPVQGRNTTVKEFISSGDYMVTVRGLLTGNNGVFPKENMENFVKGLNAPLAVEVSSWFLQIFDISNIVITGFDFPEDEGSYSTQRFELQAISDQPIELYISQ